MKTKLLSEINRNARENPTEFIKECEKNFDDKISVIADEISQNQNCDIFLLAGPSSSGKTTTTDKLTQKLGDKNIKAHRVSLDDFYFNREDIPFTKSGAKDYENIAALDLDLIHKSFENLIKNRSADLPVFDFNTGKRSDEENHIELGKDDVIIVEGIHALNPIICKGLDPEHICKAYIGVSTRIITESGQIIFSRRNLRRSRRIIRDFRHRNSSVENTLRQWGEVTQGENKYIFPYEDYADYRIDSFHAYEPGVFKNRITELLKQVDTDSEMYGEALEVMNSFKEIEPISEEFIPKNSLLMEFMG